MQQGSDQKLINEMQRDEAIDRTNISEIVELSELSLFEDDPYIQQVSQPEDHVPINNEKVHLLDGETLLHEKTFQVDIESDSKALQGQYEALSSNYRGVFFPPKAAVLLEDSNCCHEHPVSIPYALMSEIDVIKSQLLVTLKTGVTIRIKANVAVIQELYRHFLKGYMAIPFFSKNIFPDEEAITYDCLVEMQRMRIDWNYLHIVKNSSGQLCPTYPKYFVLKNLLEEELRIRIEGRIPVVAYFWNECRAAIWRTARLKLTNEPNKFNEAYMKEISRDPLCIDLREEQYPFRENHFIHNSNHIHKFVPLPSLNILFKRLCIAYAKNDQLMRLLEGWFAQLHNLLHCAYVIVEQLKSGKQVVISEQFGTDRSSQISALAQLIIDPFYRTINGFSILIEKQFVSFGHPFNFRLGYERQKMVEESPIFLQFLECVSHLADCHPGCFQFSSFYLARIGYECYSAKYNNFFFNDEELRKKYEFILRTPTLWRHLPMRKEYYNYQWREREAIKPLILLRSMPSVKQFVIWRQFYDMVTELRCECPSPSEVNTRIRRNSIYKLLNRKFDE